MFTPIKNLITYIQKNTNGNMIFGGNSVIEKSDKIDMEDAIMQSEQEIAEEKNVENSVLEKEDNNETAKISKTGLEESKVGTTTSTTTSTISTENSCEYEDEDIEAQIESSIMLKTPVKITATKGTEILEVKKSSYTNCSIVISHDFNRTQDVIPIDDELEDFRHDPTEMLGSTSSPLSNQRADNFCSIGSDEETVERDVTTVEEFITDEEEDDIEAEEEQRITDETDQEVETETVAEQKAGIEVNDENEEGEEPFLDLNNFKNTNVIVLEEVDLNASTTSIDTSTITDDPLAIACEEQEAFAADKAAALEELNLLNNSQTSHDEDTRTTADDDLQWLKTDLDDPQPSSSRGLLKKNASHITPEKEERNGEGSDSGMGSEISALHTTTTSVTDTSQLNTTTSVPPQTSSQTKIEDSDDKLLSSNMQHNSKSPPKDPPKPYRSNLKRRLEVDDVVDSLGNLASTTSSLSDHSSLNGCTHKKPKRSINFDTVQVYYFPRQQGFSCVPSAGGCTLGMAARHVGFKTLTLAEHAAELRRAHRMQLQEINPKGSSSDDSEESEEDYLSEGSGSDLDGESNGFLQPVSPKQRRALLKGAGIRKIDPSEKAECRNIRNSREVCGCTCRDFCDPETCTCSQSGIKCQVDRDMFPCGCSRDACGNTIGRVEFNPARVRTHFIHTLMRLEMENRQQQNPYSSVVGSPLPMQPMPSYYQTHLQPQSNYSSGYASPAYNTTSELHQQTAASSYYHSTTPSTTNSIYGQQNSLEITHNGSANTTNTTSQYNIDSLDTSLFGGTTTTTPSYGELIPVASYHYGNLQTQQASPYNTYHNSLYINSNNAQTPLSIPNTYSSCAVPSIPPYGTATTTEATGVYHSVSNLTNLETTTAPSCSVSCTTSLDNDGSANFISLSTPLASSSRLSQINDLLQHNRNTTTALVAVSQDFEIAGSNSKSTCESQINSSVNKEAVSSSLSSLSLSLSSINTPIEDIHKTCMVYEQLASSSEPSPIVNIIEEDKEPSEVTTSLSLPTEISQENTLNTEFLPQTTLCKTEKVSVTTVNAPVEPATIEVAAGK